MTEQGFGSYTAGFDDTLRASWGLVLDNPNAEYWIATSVNVNVSFHDAAGTVLASASDSITAVLPGQTAALAGSVELPEEPAEMRVQARARDWEQADGPGPYGGFTTSGVNVRADEFGGYTVTGAVDSSFDQDFEDVYAVALLRSDAGEIVGGDWTFLDFVPAGGSTSVELNIFDDPPGVTAADLYVMLSNLSLMSADG